MTSRYRTRVGLAILLIAILVVSQTAIIASAAPTISTDDRAVANALTTTSMATDISGDCTSAATVDATGAQNGTINSGEDTDAFKISLDQGEHIDIDANAAIQEDEFEIRISAVNDGRFSVKNVSNAAGGATGTSVERIDEINGGITASLEVWAETNTTLCFRLSDSDDADTPYDWNITTDAKSNQSPDNYPDSDADASVVSPNSTQTGAIGTPGDVDRFKIQLSDGDRVNMNALAPVAEDDFEITIDSANNGRFSVKNVSNAEGGTSDDTFHRIDQIEGGIPADWEIHAETDGTFIITVDDTRDATVPYEWQIGMQRNAPLTDQSPPTAAFSVTTQDLTTGTQITFNASDSSDPDGSVRSYDWDFNGDGDSEDAGVRTTRSFDSPGQYDVNLTVTDNDGVTDSVTKTVTISEPAQDVTVSVDAGPDGKIEIGEEVQFEAEPAGVPDDVIVDRYVWDFGNYSERTNASAKYTYVRSGTYTVSVTMISDNGSKYRTQYNGTTNVTVEPTFADVPPLGDGFGTSSSGVRRISLSEGQSIGLEATGDFDNSGEVLLYNSDGTLIQSEVVTGSGQFFGTTVRQDGTYYVAVNNLVDYTIYDSSYTYVTSVIRDPDQFEPNQNRSAATRLESNITVSEVTITEGNTVDWYSITVDGPAAINASAELSLFNPDQGDISLQLYDPNGNSIGEVNNETPDRGAENPKPYNESRTVIYSEPKQRAQVDEAGTYYIRVKGVGNTIPTSVDGLTEYNLTVTTSRTDTVEAPDFQVTGVTAPSSASVGSPITYTAEVTNTGDQQGTQNITATFAGEEVGSRAITLDAGESRTLAFTTKSDTPGIRSATVSTDEDVEQATVEVVGQEFISGQSTGDPHITTFGGASYEFMAAGDYVLAREPQGDLLVVARQVPVGDSVSNNNATATVVGDSTVIIRAESSTPVSVDGQPVSIGNGESVAVADGTGKITRQGNTYTVYYAGDDGQATTSDEHLTANIVGDRIDIELSLHPDRANAVEGLLGDTDNDASDDIAFDNGTTLGRPLDSDRLYGAFRSDWRATGEENLFGEDYYVDTFPEEIVTVGDLSEEERTRAEEALADSCLTSGTPQFFDALLDVALTGDNSYVASACQVDRGDVFDATEDPIPGAEPQLSRIELSGDENGDGGYYGGRPVTISPVVQNDGSERPVQVQISIDTDNDNTADRTVIRGGQGTIIPSGEIGSYGYDFNPSTNGAKRVRVVTEAYADGRWIKVDDSGWVESFEVENNIVGYDPQNGTYNNFTTNDTTKTYPSASPSLPDGINQKDISSLSGTYGLSGGNNLSSTDEYPWSAVIKYQSPGSNVPSSCSGAVIEERHILTAAHCVRNNTGNHWAGQIQSQQNRLPPRIIPGSNTGNYSPYGQYNVTHIQTYKKYVDNDNETYDIAVLTIEREDISGTRKDVVGTQTGTFGYQSHRANDPVYRAQAHVTGYPPQGKIPVNRHNSMWDIRVEGEGVAIFEGWDLILRNPDCEGTSLCHDVDTGTEINELAGEGVSGGPVWVSNADGHPQIISVLSRGPNNIFQELLRVSSIAIRINDKKYADIGQMIDHGYAQIPAANPNEPLDTPAPPPSGESAAATGDPHLSTFDGVGYDFQAAGEFVLARDTDGSPRIQARFQPVSDRDVSQTTAVATELDGTPITIDARDEQMLTVNGTPQTLETGESLTVGDGKIFRTPQKYIFVYPGVDDEVNDGDSRLEATVFDDRLDVVVKPNRNAVNSMSGLLGSPDGNAGNDLARADGTTLSTSPSFDALYGQYRDDWRVTSDTSLFDYDDGESTAGFYDPEYPSEQVTIDDLPAGEREEAIQVATNAGLEPGTTEFHDAVLDYALTGDQSYVASASLATSEANTTTDATPPETALTEPSLTVTTENRVISRNQSLSVSVAASHPNPGEATVLVSNGSSIVFEEDVSEAFASEQVISWNTTLDGQSVDDGFYTLGVVTTSESGVRNVTTQGLLIDNSAPSVRLETTNTTVGTDVNSTRVSFSYNDTESGIDPDSVVITEDGTDVTGEAQINANNASYRLTDLERNENRTIEIQVANNASIKSTQSVTITVADGFSVAQFDRNDDGQIGFDELRFALREFNNGNITFDQFRRVLQAFNTGAAV